MTTRSKTIKILVTEEIKRISLLGDSKEMGSDSYETTVHILLKKGGTDRFPWSAPFNFSNNPSS